MRKLLSLLLLVCLASHAQVRGFIMGLDSYFYGPSGSLDFQVAGKDVAVSLSDGAVSVNGALLSEGSPDTVIGLHDFTGNRQAELVVARRDGSDLNVCVYSFSGGRWGLIGRMTAPGGKEVRVFRQVISARCGEVLRSWTWHGAGFDHKASDGSPDPSLP